MLWNHYPVKVGYPPFLSAPVQEIALSGILNSQFHAVYVYLNFCYQACIGLSAFRSLYYYLRNLLSFHLLVEKGYDFIEVVFFKIQLQIISHHLLARTRFSDRGYIIIFSI